MVAVLVISGGSAPPLPPAFSVSVLVGLLVVVVWGAISGGVRKFPVRFLHLFLFGFLVFLAGGRCWVSPLVVSGFVFDPGGSVVVWLGSVGVRSCGSVVVRSVCSFRWVVCGGCMRWLLALWVVRSGGGWVVWVSGVVLAR